MMEDTEARQQEAEDMRMAVSALDAAQKRAMDSGDVIIVVGDELVSIGPSGRTILKKMPPRPKVLNRIKLASK